MVGVVLEGSYPFVMVMLLTKTVINVPRPLSSEEFNGSVYVRPLTQVRLNGDIGPICDNS